MVAKLLQGILKKAEKPGEEVPDELPPIKDDASKEEPQQEAQNAEAPAELPDIQEAPAVMPMPQAVQPEELPSMPEPDEQAAEDEPMQAKAKAEATAPDQPEGFFSKLSHLLKSDKGSEQLMKQSLLTTMKESYSIKKEAAKTGLNLTEEKRIKQSLDEVMATLKLLEGKWRAQKMVIDEDERTLKEYEQTIRENEKKLKQFLRQYKIFQAADKPLVLKNYLEVRNISEFYNALRTLEEKVYLSHISKGKNDFADFVRQLDRPLAEKLRLARSKTGMLKALEMFISEHKQ